MPGGFHHPLVHPVLPGWGKCPGDPLPREAPAPVPGSLVLVACDSELPQPQQTQEGACCADQAGPVQPC